ncbi:MAG: sugar porter family MFS transporter [Desulfovibrionaceae bacterium]|nr:sugar porter family MFS transporter [Desulfovibrionaceae bacterium]
MNGKLFFWAISTALAGLLFGFDTVVISGAESTIQHLWNLSGSMHGLAISSALWGTVLGAVTGSIPTEGLGRKKSLIIVGFLYFISAIGSGVAWDVSSFIFFRFIGGLGIGFATVASPLFIAEISPAKDRGKLTALFQFNIVLGILLAFLSNFIISLIFPPETAWRWMLAAEGLPAFVYLIMCFGLPESPRYLIVKRGETEKAKAILKQINPEMSDKELDALVADVRHDIEQSQMRAKKRTPFFSRRLRYPILYAFLIAAFNQLSGINIILYFAPRLLELAGSSDPLFAAISLGITNFIFTLLGVRFIDKLGRKTLLLIGCVGYIISLGVCTCSFMSCAPLKVVSACTDVLHATTQMEKVRQEPEMFLPADRAEILAKHNAAIDALNDVAIPANYNGPHLALAKDAPLDLIRTKVNQTKMIAAADDGSVSIIVLGCMILFIASHAIGSGTIIWVFISEIFPTEHRAAGQSLGSSTHWIFAAGLTLFFPIVMAHFDAGVMFAFFCIMMCIQLAWATMMMPETRGQTLEALARQLARD